MDIWVIIGGVGVVVGIIAGIVQVLDYIQKRRDKSMPGQNYQPLPPASAPQISQLSGAQPDDVYSAYKVGLQRLLARLGRDHPRYAEALVYQQRLSENIAMSRRHGGTETLQAERSEIIEQLNELALSALDVPFCELGSQVTPETRQELTPHLLPHNLPPRSEFVGREAEKAQVHEALQSRSRLVSVDGIGGIGKTALALEVAHECLHASQGERLTEGVATFDGFIWTTAKDRDLASDDLFDTVARTLDYPGIAQKPVGEKRAAVRRLLQAKPYLLIVDNFETITDASVQDFLIKLPEPSRVLITTREQVLFDAQMLSLKRLTESEGLALIRKQGTRLGVTSVEQAEDKMLLRLYEATGGAPLAIKWAVGQIRRRGQSLDKVLAALQNARGDVFEAMFARSWLLLSDAARNILMLLSIFPAATSWEAIGAVSGMNPSTVDEALGHLVEMSLVDSSLVDSSYASNEVWYSVHPLTRAFVRAQLQGMPELSERFHRRAVEYYIGFARQYGGSRINWHAYGKIEPELANILGMANWCYERASAQKCKELHGRNLIDLGWALRNFFWTRCYWHEGVDFFEKVIDVSERLGDLKSIGWRAYDAGWLSTRFNIGKASELAEQSLRTFEEMDYRRGKGFAWHLLGGVARGMAEYDEAAEYLNKAMEALKEKPNDLVVVWLSYGLLAHRRGNLKEAEHYLRQVVESGDVAYEARVWPALGLVYLEQHDLSQARDCFEKGLRVANKVGRKDAIAYCHYSLARMSEYQGNYKQALRLAESAADAFERLDFKRECEEAQALVSRLSERLHWVPAGKLGQFWRVFSRALRCR